MALNRRLNLRRAVRLEVLPIEKKGPIIDFGDKISRKIFDNEI